MLNRVEDYSQKNPYLIIKQQTKEKQVIIKHVVNLETVINEDVNNPGVHSILAMSEETRNAFFQIAGAQMIEQMLKQVNDGNTWAELRVAKENA